MQFDCGLYAVGVKSSISVQCLHDQLKQLLDERNVLELGLVNKPLYFDENRLNSVVHDVIECVVYFGFHGCRCRQLILKHSGCDHH